MLTEQPSETKRSPLPVVLEEAAELDLEAAQFALDRAAEAHDAGDLEGFATQLSEAAKLGHAGGDYNLGFMAQQNGAWLLAEARFLRALVRDPDYENAKLELARMYAEGWGRPRDYDEATKRFLELASSSSPRVRGIAHANLGIFALYAMGTPHSLTAARKHLKTAAEAGVEEAKELLHFLPTGLQSWPGAVPEPARTWATTGIDTEAWSHYSRPDWAPGIRWQGPGDQPPVTGTFVAEQVIAVGVPGPAMLGSTPGSAKRVACFELGNGRDKGHMTYRTWHTNGQVCEDTLFVDAVEGDVVRFHDNNSVSTTDVRTGASTGGYGCQVRARIGAMGIKFLEDWPRQCSRRQCGEHGELIGRQYAWKRSKIPCKELNAQGDHDTLQRVMTDRPAWAVVDPSKTSTRLSRYTGVWSDTHMMPLITGDDPKTGEALWEDQKVTDELRSCPSENDSHRFNLDNWTVNGHGCFLAGTPAINAAGDLLLVTDPVNYLQQSVGLGPSELACTLRVRRSKGRLVLKNVWPEECLFGECGARAHPTAASFGVRSRDKSRCKQPYTHPME